MPLARTLSNEQRLRIYPGTYFSPTLVCFLDESILVGCVTDDLNVPLTLGSLLGENRRFANGAFAGVTSYFTDPELHVVEALGTSHGLFLFFDLIWHLFYTSFSLPIR